MQKKILVIEDSLLTRNQLVKYLKANTEYQIEEAKEGNEGIAKVLEFKPDCILLDLLIPGITGFDIIKYMKTNELSIPVIVISADTQDTSRNKCIEMGVNNFIRKPFKLNFVIDAVNMILL